MPDHNAIIEQMRSTSQGIALCWLGTCKALKTQHADEPYVSAPILDQALELGIALIPGDDSHGVATVGRQLATGIRILRERGFDTHWRRPVA